MTHSNKTIQLLKGKEKRIKDGHLWVFSNEIKPNEIVSEMGDVVRLMDANNNFLGTAFYHPNSLIALRVLSHQDTMIDESFFLRRLQKALSLRNKTIHNTDAYRLVHAESDMLPGLIVDCYNRGVVIQILSAGMEKQRHNVVNALKSLLNPIFIAFKNDHPMRQREGLTLYNELALGDKNDIPIEVTENSVRYSIDPFDSESTGMYLSQREHRKTLRQYITKGDRVLDAFCHHAGFAINAALGGASDVTAIDNSANAIEKARYMVELNQLQDSITTIQEDLKVSLPKMEKRKETFDVINLDPPDLALTRKNVGPALRQYRDFHGHAMKMLKPGGILATSCQSLHISRAAFMDSILRACKDVKREVQLLHRGENPADHPVKPEMPETDYLKFLVFQVNKPD